jgi:hypothetical protein
MDGTEQEDRGPFALDFPERLVWAAAVVAARRPAAPTPKAPSPENSDPDRFIVC